MSTFAEQLWDRREDLGGGLRFEGRSWAWAEVVHECVRRARVIESLRAGGAPVHVGIFLENVPDYVFWLGAGALTGSVVVGVNPTRRGEDLAQDLRHTEVSLLVVEDRSAALLEGLDIGVGADHVLNVDSADYLPRLDAYGAEPYSFVAPAREEMLLLLFSSGSTGAPKAVICSQGRLGDLAQALAERMEIARDSVTYLCMPLFHGNAVMTNLAPAVLSGATVVLARRFSASRLIGDLRDHGVTFWNYVGRALAYVLATPERPDDRDNSLRLAYGTEASAADAERFAERFGCRVMEGYGASEGGLRINRTADSPEGSLGIPVGPRPMDIVNEETGAVCEPARFDEHGLLLNGDAAVGQMVVRGGASAFEGYYRNPDAMAERVRGEDFWTGDLAYRDVDGFVYFAGRTADWIRVDSENIAAAPIERVLQRQEGVSQAVVYGVPDPRTGDQVMATLELATDQQFDPGRFGKFLDAQSDLGTKWRPRFVRISRNLPVTGNGKVARSELRLEGWRTEDETWWATDRGYERLTAEARDQIVEDFARHGRSHLIGGTVVNA